MSMEGIDIQAIVRQAVREFIAMENTPTEPGWKAELREEIMHREQLERRVNELVTANRETMRARAADQLRSAVACELRWHGVEDVGLYGPAIEREIYLDDSGLPRFMARNGMTLSQYVAGFLGEPKSQRAGTGRLRTGK